MRKRLPQCWKEWSVLPGFGLTLGYTLFYLSLIVLIPMGGLLLRASAMEWETFWKTVTSQRAWAAYRLTFGAAFLGAGLNVVMGSVVAWTLVRYRFPGRRLLDALVDMPFALPTAVAGIALTAIYAPEGWVGRWFKPLGIEMAFSPWGVLIAMTFMGLPYVVRTVQPVLLELDPEIEEAAASLGASRWQTLFRVVFPTLMPALLTGFALAFARSLGEYGSVIFISGNRPLKTEIVSLLIVTKLEEYDEEGAMALAVVMMGVSFLLLWGIHRLQRWSRRYEEGS